MSRSMLVYQELPPPDEGAVATIVALHGHGGTLDDLVPLCREIHRSVRIIAPQAARPVNAAHRTYSLENPGGYRWYFGEPGTEPEPATFGESLWSVEQFVYDVKERIGQSEPIILLGVDQGARVALTMATIIPDCLAGVVAIRGSLPVIRGWSPPAETLDHLPILLVDDADETSALGTSERAHEELENRNAALTKQAVPGVSHDPALAAAAISGWFDANRSKFAAGRVVTSAAGVERKS
jgi:predicted esterase